MPAQEKVCPPVRWLAPSCPCLCWGDAGAHVVFGLAELCSCSVAWFGRSAACGVFPALRLVPVCFVPEFVPSVKFISPSYLCEVSGAASAFNADLISLQIPTRLCASVWAPKQRGRISEPCLPSASTMTAHDFSAVLLKDRYVLTHTLITPSQRQIRIQRPSSSCHC